MITPEIAADLINESLHIVMLLVVVLVVPGLIVGLLVALVLLAIPWVEAVDVANACLFLASDEARYITAVSLPVDAGSTQR